MSSPLLAYNHQPQGWYMTRILRTSCWVSMERPPMTLVFRDSDTNDSLEASKFKSELPGGFYIHDIFDSEHANPSMPEATFEAMARIDPHYEQNMAVLFFYTKTVCDMTAPDGLWVTPDPCPLKVEDIVYIFRRVVEQSWYEGQTFNTRDETGMTITVKDGEVLIGDQP